MDACEFVRTFRNEELPHRLATVALNDRLLVARDWTVSVEDVSSLSELAELGLVWYFDDAVEPVADVQYDHPGAQRATVAKAVELLATAFDHRNEKVEAEAAKLDDGELFLPAYRAPNRRTILLDGSHRCCAILTRAVSVKIQLAIVEGIDDPRALPDLFVSD